MSMLYKAAGWGTVFAILALVVTLLKQIIAFVGFLTFAIKILIVLAFIAVIFGVGFMILKSFNKNRQTKI